MMNSDTTEDFIRGFHVIWEDCYQDSFNTRSYLWYELIVNQKNKPNSISEYKLIARAPYDDSRPINVELWYQTCGNGFKLYHHFRMDSVGNQPTKDVLREKSLEILKLYINKPGR